MGFETNAEITWCPGCGNYGIRTAFQNTVLELEKRGVRRENIVISSGIGCHAKLFDYVNLSGIYGLHGRNSSNAEGIKIANPELKIVTFSGDGNGFGEGLAHTIYAAKRNQDITLVLHNNNVYALTTGQFSSLTPPGWRGPSTPRGSFEIPFNAMSLMIEVGATFVARSYAGDIKHLTETLIEAIEHEGFSFIEVLQPAMPYHKWEEYKDKIEFLSEEPKSRENSLEIAHKTHRFTIGIFHQEIREVYHKSLYGNLNPVKDNLPRDKRLEKISEILKP